jgi:hypothetical protein
MTTGAKYLQQGASTPIAERGACQIVGERHTALEHGHCNNGRVACLRVEAQVADVGWRA